MMRWTATFVSAVVIVFSLTFIVTRRTAATAPTAPRLVVSPIADVPPLRVRTLRSAPALPRLRRPRGGATTAAPATAPAAAPVAPPSTPPSTPPSSSSSNSTRPTGPGLCARAAWIQQTGGAPALPRTGRC